MSAPNAMNRVAAIVGVVVGVITIVGFAASIGAKIAAADFVTHEQHEKALADLRSEFREKVDAISANQAVRDKALADRIDALRADMKEANEGLTKQLGFIASFIQRERR